tara:strand:- start:165 stop:929 length:765 start_codon:yes stop_codon:yes gene_type:complete
MNRIYIFDVDGTLTPSRQKMTKEFKEFFEKWTKKNKFYLVTGSDLPKLQEQMDYMDILAEGIFTCCGNQFWRPDPHIVNVSAELIYDNKFYPPDSLIEYLEEHLKNSKYFARCGNHIENRGSMLNFSIVGRDCTLQERENYFEWDNQTKERLKIAKGIQFGWPELDAVIGGQISIDIYPKGKDKSQILEHIEDENSIPFGEPAEYIFIGDRTEEGGNDYPLAQLLTLKDTPYGYAYQTDGWENTKRILEKLYND